jgi:hypothetical protein
MASNFDRPIVPILFSDPADKPDMTGRWRMATGHGSYKTERNTQLDDRLQAVRALGSRAAEEVSVFCAELDKFLEGEA